MAKFVTYIFIATSLILWYFLIFGGFGSVGHYGIQQVDAASNIREGRGGSDRSSHSSMDNSDILDGRGYAIHHGGSHHIRRNINHCWRRYDGYNLQNTVINKKEQMKKPFGILCNFKCTWFFTITFPSCEFIYDYKLSCYLFTSLPDCTNVKCTLLNYFN